MKMKTVKFLKADIFIKCFNLVLYTIKQYRIIYRQTKLYK